MTNDYTIIDPRSGMPTLDVSRLMELSDKEFRKWRLEDMGTFIVSHYNFSGHYPFCSECGVELRKPENLIRYFGASLNPDCFKEVYSKARDQLSENEQKYFDRVEGLFC